MGRVLPANQFAPRACSRTPAPSIDARRAHDVTANMNDAEVERQIHQMVAFIKQEAEEKSSEIRVTA